MRIRTYAQTDTVYIEFRNAPVAETRDLDENTLLDVDTAGDIRAITVEHASHGAGRRIKGLRDVLVVEVDGQIINQAIDSGLGDIEDAVRRNISLPGWNRAATKGDE